ncbi:TetR/AcrR family transcriptional regulator [Malaciobacter mytili]|uniref:TetR/AcrR family transcriptional regulator n=1 Tax=Malaciobacter mytili TaxID=603050 RepID=UPI003A8C06BE
MAIKKTSKEEILLEAIKLFKTKGYYNTSMADIGKACGLIKGSIYHHFKNKEEIGLEALKYIDEFFEKNIFIIKDENITTKEKLEKIVTKTDEYFLKSEGGCLFGNLASEVSRQNSEFKTIITLYFKKWQDSIYQILNEKLDKDKANFFSYEYICALQGAIIMMNLTDNTSSYLEIGKKLKEKV